MTPKDYKIGLEDVLKELNDPKKRRATFINQSGMVPTLSTTQLDRSIAAVQEALQKQTPCEWTLYWPGYWHTLCGDMLPYGGFGKSRFTHCPFCGHPLNFVGRETPELTLGETAQ